MQYIESGKEAGATVAIGGGHYESREQQSGGFYVEPTIFTNVTPDMKIVQEEIFGRVVVLAKFKDEEEAIELANDTSYGLSSVVFTQNISRAIRVSSAVEAGNVFVSANLTTLTSPPTRD